MTIEEKLEHLDRCGLRLSEKIGIQDLTEIWGRETLDEPGFGAALVCLGMTQEVPPWAPHCENLWHFDTECIYDKGDYVAIAKRMSEMTGGSLVLSNLDDHIDVENGEAWLRFQCAGKPVHIDCEVDDDWVDCSVFDHFVKLLAECDPNKVFIYYDLGGQDCIIGCVTRAQYQMLLTTIPEIKLLS